MSFHCKICTDCSFSVDKPQPMHSENNENNKLPTLYKSNSTQPRAQFQKPVKKIFYSSWRCTCTRCTPLDWIEQGLTSPPTQYRLSRRQFYRSKDPTNSIKVTKEKLASPARQSPTQQAGLYKSCIELQIMQQQMLQNTWVRQDLGYCTLFAPSQHQWWNVAKV